MSKLNKTEKLILEGLEERYGTEVIANAIAAMQNSMNNKEEIEEPEDEDVVMIVSEKEAVLDYIKFLEGCHSRIKELHWAEEDNAKHELIDSFCDKVYDVEDSIAEDLMGYLGIRIKVGEITPIYPKSADFTAFLNEIEDKTLTLEASLEAEVKCRGAISILDDFIHDINKTKYLDSMK